MLNWANRFSIFCFLDNHQYHHQASAIECMLAAGIKDGIQCNAGEALDQLQQFINIKPRWLFGHLAYDLKNEIETLASALPDPLRFPDLFFFEPEVLIRLDEHELVIESSHEDEEKIYRQIISTGVTVERGQKKLQIESRMGRDEYISVIQKLKEHILKGDCYEINFCQDFFSEDAVIDPVAVYQKLSSLSPNPFSGLYKLEDQYLVCASPERYLKKQGTTILSQPIKGTSKRDADGSIDEKNKNDLFTSPKERSENVMVVDLVRNDLSKVCVEGTVHVDELYGVYSFPQVHQMISTISGELKKDISFTEIIRASFPMGSMTGAPKKKVMELIEQYEQTRRGIFSGALGYINPDGDFDFNVVIRSIMYDERKKYLSFKTGSGVTFYCDPEKEWEECMMKAGAMMRVFEQ